MNVSKMEIRVVGDNWGEMMGVTLIVMRRCDDVGEHTRGVAPRVTGVLVPVPVRPRVVLVPVPVFP